VRSGKPESGTLTIEARYQAGEVWIIVSDNGRGLNRDKILAKGLERGLVPPAPPCAMKRFTT
jgi:two-component system chemotaxis sensor kinase CheA